MNIFIYSVLKSYIYLISNIVINYKNCSKIVFILNAKTANDFDKSSFTIIES